MFSKTFKYLYFAGVFLKLVFHFSVENIVLLLPALVTLLEFVNTKHTNQ